MTSVHARSECGLASKERGRYCGAAVIVASQFWKGDQNGKAKQ